MEKTVYDITLALGQSPARRLVTVKRYDSHCTLRLRLVSGGKPYPVTEDCHGVFTARKPDGTVIYNPCAREGNVFLYELTPQTTAAVGELRCELKLYGPEEALLTSAAFLMEVADTVYSGDEELASSTEAEALTRMTENARQGVEQMQAVLEQAEDLVRIGDSTVGKLAWSAKRIVDTLCPAFEKSGPVVKGDLLQDYPLEICTRVQQPIDGLSLTVCGKNLFDFQKGTGVVEFISNTGNLKYAGYDIKLPAGVYTIHGERSSLAPESNYYIGVRVVDADRVLIPNDISGAGWIIWGDESTRRTLTVTIEEGCSLLVYDGYRQGNPDTNASNVTFSYDNIQLEAGDSPTPYEPYRGETWQADFSQFPAYNYSEAVYNWNTAIVNNEEEEHWQHNLETGAFENIPDMEEHLTQSIRVIPAQSGENYIYCSTGQVTVRGRRDPVTLLEKLTAAVL